MKSWSWLPCVTHLRHVRPPKLICYADSIHAYAAGIQTVPTYESKRGSLPLTYTYAYGTDRDLSDNQRDCCVVGAVVT